MIEGNLKIKLPTIWTDGKQRWEESEKRKEEERRKKVREEKESEHRKINVREKVEKSRNTSFFRCFCSVAPEGREVGSLKRAEPPGQMRDKQLHAAVA